MSKKLTAILLALVLCAALLPLGLSPITAAGSGTKADPILVGTPADFNNIRNNLKAYYKLTADIDLSGFCTGEEGWEPIGKDGGKDGSKGDRFEGGLNGAGYKITGLKINRVEADGKPIRDIGLFGAASITAEFENINLVDVDIKGGGCVGGLVGRWGNEYWRDCCEDMIDMDMTPGHSHSEYYVTRYGKDCKEGIFKNIEISGEITGYYFVGGVIGYTDGWESTGGSIENAVNKAKVSGNSPLSRVPALDKWRPDGTYVGGIIGKMRHAAPFKLTNCVNHGDIYNRQSCTGGIVGSLAGGNPELHGMRFCANFGNIHSEGGLVGGLVGTEAYRNELPRTIEDCFSGGRIFGVTKIGGIMGDGGAEITRCAFINTTDVAPTDTAFAITGLYVHSRFAGGIIGHAMSETKITDCFALFTLCANNPDMVGGAVKRMLSELGIDPDAVIEKAVAAFYANMNRTVVEVDHSNLAR
ncbi:MAG: hypothetical protein FWD16_03520, partial [Clostridia bacterium]|nr:hypothetical protein [Clostridia bacterium]